MKYERADLACLTLLLVSCTVVAAARPRSFAQVPAQPAPVPRDSPRTPPAGSSETVDVTASDGSVRALSLGAIRQAKTGTMTRYGQQFEVTPFTIVMRLAGIAADARIRVVGEEEELTLQSASGADSPADYGFIFNLRGRPVLTPLPPRGAARDASREPQDGVGGRGDTRSLPPAGSAPGARGNGSGSGPGMPTGFAPLREVRSVVRVEVVR
jgi:hypothetical protein